MAATSDIPASAVPVNSPDLGSTPELEAGATDTLDKGGQAIADTLGRYFETGAHRMSPHQCAVYDRHSDPETSGYVFEGTRAECEDFIADRVFRRSLGRWRERDVPMPSSPENLIRWAALMFCPRNYGPQICSR